MKKTMTVLFLSGIFISQIGFAKENDIIHAAKSGNAEKVKTLLRSDPELIRTVDSVIGATALHWALIYGKKVITERSRNNPFQDIGGQTIQIDTISIVFFKDSFFDSRPFIIIYANMIA